MVKRSIMVAGFVVAALLLAACGETSNADPTPVQTWKITPASGGGVATATPATADETPTQSSGSGGNGETVLQLVGANTLFDKDELEAPAGTITIEFDNRDGGIPHNVNVFAGEDATGESVGATELEVGPVQQTLTLVLEPGTYFYQCDAHPATMAGILTVT